MEALVVGDIHFDRWAEAGRDPFASLHSEDWANLDALFVAGDLTNKPRVRWKYAIRHLARHIDPGRIHIIPGNHDYYDFQIDRDDRLAEIAAGEGANLAQKAEVTVADTRFLCCTLWTDFALRGDVSGSQAIARERMNDYRYIRNAKAGYRKVRPYETVQIHQEHRAWLEDRLTRATELLGVLTAFGPAQKLPELTPDDWDHAGRVGYDFTSRGEGGIRETLEVQFRKFDDASGTPGARKIFGSFYNALAHSKSLKEPGDIARILREVITENIALSAGTKVLGVELPERRLHTVRSLAVEQNVDPRTLSNVLVAAGAIPERAPAHFPVPVGRGREITGRMKRTVNMVSLWKDMNFTRPIVDQLFDDRLLTPIYHGRPGAKGRTQKAVDREEVAMLVGKLHAKAVELDAETCGLVPVSKAAEKGRVPAITVVHMILGGFLERVFRLSDADGIGALRVDPTEVKRLAGSCTTGLSPIAVFGKLKIPRDVGWRLVDRYPAEVSLAVTWIVGPDGSHRTPRFDPAVVDDFKARFIHPARLAERHDLQIGDVIGRLKRRGVRPVVPKDEIGLDFYRTSDLEPDLFT